RLMVGARTALAASRGERSPKAAAVRQQEKLPRRTFIGAWASEAPIAWASVLTLEIILEDDFRAARPSLPFRGAHAAARRRARLRRAPPHADHAPQRRPLRCAAGARAAAAAIRGPPPPHLAVPARVVLVSTAR